MKVLNDDQQCNSRQVLTVSQMIDILINKFEAQERVKNEHMIIGSSNAKEYRMLKNSLEKFTIQKYRRSFSTYSFKEIKTKFLLDYVAYLENRGAENRNNGSVCGRLKKLYAVFNHAKNLNLSRIDSSVFQCVEDKMKPLETLPILIPYKVMQAIENIDRNKFSRLEQFHIDMFLFSFLTGGMTNTDMAYLTIDCIQEENIVYEKIRFNKTIRIPLIDKAKEIMDKYKDQCHENFALPIFSRKHQTEQQQRERIERLSNRVNKTLNKVCKVINCKKKITWHSAQVAFIVRLLESGYDSFIIAKYTGCSLDTILKYRNYTTH
jgi:site-specific recombinase XerD